MVWTQAVLCVTATWFEALMICSDSVALFEFRHTLSYLVDITTEIVALVHHRNLWHPLWYFPGKKSVSSAE